MSYSPTKVSCSPTNGSYSPTKVSYGPCMRGMGIKLLENIEYYFDRILVAIYSTVDAQIAFFTS